MTDQMTSAYADRLVDIRQANQIEPWQEGFVYVAGPYRGKHTVHDYTIYTDIDANINNARRWSVQLAEHGIPFFCPHLNSAHFEVIAPSVPSEYWLYMDTAILAEAKALLLVDGWRESSGARAEKEFAMTWGIAVFTHNLFDQLLGWWEERLRALHR